MLLITPVGSSVGRTSLTMLLNTEVRSPPVGRSVGRVISLMMLDTPLARPVARGRPVGIEIEGRSVGPGRSVTTDTTSLRMLEMAIGVTVGPKMSVMVTITLALVEKERLMGSEMLLSSENTSLMMLEAGRPGRMGAEAEL